MFSPTALRILADPERVNDRTLRFLIRLMTTYDLTRFRVFHMQRLIEHFCMEKETIALYISNLVAVGILEEGPQGQLRGQTRMFATYRIRPQMMASPKEMLEWFRETRERDERESLMPAIPGKPVVTVVA